MPVRQLLWFRNDLRLQDHGLLAEAIRRGWEIIPCYCFDPRQFGTTAFGFPKTGSYRAQFLLESLADLRRSLQALGSDLVIRQGYPEVILPELIQQLKADSFAYHREVTTEETSVEARLKAALQPLGTDVQTAWGATLFHPEDLPLGWARFLKFLRSFVRRSKSRSPCATASPLPGSSQPCPQTWI